MSVFPVLLAVALLSAPPGSKKVAVLDFDAPGVDDSVALTANTVLQALVRNQRVEVELLLPGEGTRCANAKCLVDIGREQGAQEVVAGRLVGRHPGYTVELQRVLVAQGRVVRFTKRASKGSEEALAETLKQSVAELYAEPKGAAPQPEPEPVAKDKEKGPPVKEKFFPGRSYVRRCDALYLVGKWTLCKVSDAVAYAWFGPEGDPAVKFLAASKGPWYARHGLEEWMIRAVGGEEPCGEPWDEPIPRALRKRVIKVSSGLKEYFELGETRFSVTNDQIWVTLPDSMTVELNGDRQAVKFRDAMSKGATWFGE